MEVEPKLLEIRDKLIEVNLVTPSQLVGCTKDEILKLEKEFKVNLPKTYKDFLMLMGHKSGDYFIGTDIHYKSLFDLREGADELLKECKYPFVLEPNDFVFSMHQGYQFWFFKGNTINDDPPVYYYLEEEKNFKKVFESFSGFLLDSLKNHL